MAQAGYEGTELGPQGYFPTDAALLARELSQRGLAMIGAFVPVSMRERSAHDRALASVEEVARLLAQLGASHIILAEEGDAQRQGIAGRADLTLARGMTDEQWQACVDGWHEAARRCRTLGLQLCIHPHGGTYVEHPQEIHRLMASTDPQLIQLCFDTGHVAFGGGDPLDVVRRYGDRIGLVHLKDIALDLLRDGVAAGKDYARLAQEDVFVALGTGSLDLKAIMEGLRAAGYDGWIVVEQDRVLQPGEDSLEAALHNRRYLKDNFGL